MPRRALLLVCLACLPTWAVAAEDIFQTTTEFDVTVTTTDLIDAIQETQDFWYPVRQYVGSEKFAFGDTDSRKQAAEFIRKVNNRLADQLFSQDDAASTDLIQYLSSRLRLFATYRELHATIGDDHLTMAIKECWEHELRVAHAVDRQQRAQAMSLAGQHVEEYADSIGLDADQCQTCAKLWNRAGLLWSKLHDSQAGQIMLVYEREVDQCDPQLAQLIRDVVCAADWAQITKTQQRVLRRIDFERAWVDLQRYRGERVARLTSE